MLHLSLARRLRSIPADLLIDRAVLVAVVLAGVVAISPNVADPDLWGHVQYGRDLLKHGLPTRTTYSYIAQEQPWINHENLVEVALAWGADYLGPLGLVASKMLAGMGLLLVVLHTCRKQGAGLLASSLMVLLTASGVAYYWSLRPQLFSFLAYAAMLWLFSWCFAGWEGRWQFTQAATEDPTPADVVRMRPFHLRISWLWLIPLLMIAWTNAHGGFLVGCAVFTTYLIVRSCEAYYQAGARAIGTIKRFAVWAGATLIATFFNPYGYDFHFWLLEDLRVPRPEIIEWLPPSITDPNSIPLFLLMAVLGVTLACSRRSWDAAHLAILAATLCQSLTHHRHIPFFALSVAFFLPRHVEDVLARLGTKASGSSIPCQPLTPALSPEYRGEGENRKRWAAGWIASGLFVIYAVLGCKLYERASDLKVQRGSFPVSAVQFMADRDLAGRVLCAFNWAQYALSALPPGQLQVHVDGRCRTAYSQAMLDEHFDFLFGDQPASQRYRDPKSSFDPTKALEHGHPNLVLIDRRQPHAVQVVTGQSIRWVLLYQDELAQLWGRRERYDDPQCSDYLPPARRHIGDDPQTGHLTWPALPVASR